MTFPSLDGVRIGHTGDIRYRDLPRRNRSLFEVQAAPDASSYLESVEEQSGKRAVAVDIGAHPGVVIWQDPLIEDTFRPHRVIWATEGQLYTMIGDYDAEDLVEMARSAVCS